ncbi:MAG: ABC transporter ATP-binding protein [Thiotrichales bacterium]
MIQLNKLTKSYRTRSGRRYVFRDLDLSIPEGVNVGLIGGNGAGKSTLMRILGGIDFPDAGEVVTQKRISWPLALSGGFQGSLSGRENVKFVCRVFGREDELEEKVQWIKAFSELGDYFEEPVKSYSSGMKSRLAFAMSMGFEFDVYLVDEITAVGDQAFRDKSRQAFHDLRERASIIMVSHDLGTLKAQCDVGVLIEDGNAFYFDRIDDAIDRYRKGPQ